MHRTGRILAYDLPAILLLLLGWHMLSATGMVSRAFVPSPAAAAQSLWWGFTHGGLGRDTLATVLLMVQGWLLASIIGVILGSLIGSWRPARDTLGPILEFLRPLPASAIIPVAIALFGLGSSMVIGVVAFGSIWPLLLATIHGFATVEPRLREVAAALRLSPLAFIRKIGLPNAVPDILGGMRLSLTVALILAVVTEMLAGRRGLGTFVLLAGRSFNSADMFAGLVVLAIVGWLSSALLQFAERYLLRWQR
ncbi:ABC transporter permease [Mesorhizobium sp. 10J20-29]